MLVSWLCILLVFWQVFTSSGTTIPPYMRKNKTKNFKLYLTNDKKNIIFLLCYLQQRETLSKHYLRLLFIFEDILVITFNLSECKCGCKRTLIILTFCSNSLRKARCEVQCDSATQTAVAWCPHGRCPHGRAELWAPSLCASLLQVPEFGGGERGAAGGCARRRGCVALAVPQAGVPQVRQAVQLPAPGGQGGRALHPLPGRQGHHQAGANGIPHLHKVSAVLHLSVQPLGCLQPGATVLLQSRFISSFHAPGTPMSLWLGGSWVFIWQQISDASDTICHLRQRAAFPVNGGNIIVGKWQLKLGHLMWFCQLWGQCCPRLQEGFPNARSWCTVQGGFALWNCTLQCQGTQFIFSHTFYLGWGFFHCFYGYICSSHGTNISFSVFHWLWQKKWAAAADVLLKHRSCFYADAFSIQEWI